MKKIKSFWDIPLWWFLAALAVMVSLDIWLVARDFKNPTFVEVPERCEIESPRHAPCLIDLTTGNVGEMQIFTEYITNGELDANQLWGVFHFASCGPDTHMAVDKDNGKANVTVNNINEKPRLYRAYRYFCEADRSLIYDLVKDNRVRWLLADLYSVGSPVYYILEPGEYDIRDYHLAVSNSDLEENAFTIEITTDLFLEEREAMKNGD